MEGVPRKTTRKDTVAGRVGLPYAILIVGRLQQSENHFDLLLHRIIILEMILLWNTRAHIPDRFFSLGVAGIYEPQSKLLGAPLSIVSCRP